MSRIQLVDLHVHSVFSDGKLTPAELAGRAADKGVSALAITDHDTLDGAEEKITACKAAGIECVIGVELSCELAGRETHILSLFANPASARVDELAELKKQRQNRMSAMLERLSQRGIFISLEELPTAENGIYGRPHLARALINRGIVKNINEAFGQFLYDHGPIHIPKVRLTAKRGIAFAKELGGLAIVAHPGISGLIPELDTLRDYGLDGIEVFHPKHSSENIAKLMKYAAENKLAVSGGSDFHSPGEGYDIGASRVPFEVLTKLKDAFYKGTR